MILEDEPRTFNYDLTTALGRELAAISNKPIQVPPIKQDAIIDFIIASNEPLIDTWYTREAKRIKAIRDEKINTN